MSDTPIYWTNPLEHQFEVTIDSCTKNGDVYELGINEAVVRPAGGGQAGDRGTLSIDGNPIRIQDTALIEGVVTLIAEREVEPNSIGILEIDMDWRRKSMRNHTAEHIFMSAMKSIKPDAALGYIWIDGDQGTVDVLGGEVGLEEILTAEMKVQEIIQSKVPVISEMVSAADLPESVRAREGVTDKHESMRVISVGDFDKSACSGIHVLNTGDIGVFKVTDFKSIEGGVRIEFVTNRIAVTRLLEIFNQILKRKRNYPYEMEQIGSIIDKAKSASEDRIAMIDKISDLVTKSPGLKLTDQITFIHHYLPGFNAKQMKLLVKKLKPDGSYAALLFAPDEKPTLVFVTGNMPKDASKYVSEIVEELGGRGGGSKDVYTGGFSEADDPTDLYEKLVEEVKKKLA